MRLFYLTCDSASQTNPTDKFLENLISKVKGPHLLQMATKHNLHMKSNTKTSNTKQHDICLIQLNYSHLQCVYLPKVLETIDAKTVASTGFFALRAKLPKA